MQTQTIKVCTLEPSLALNPSSAVAETFPPDPGAPRGRKGTESLNPKP